MQLNFNNNVDKYFIIIKDQSISIYEFDSNLILIKEINLFT